MDELRLKLARSSAQSRTPDPESEAALKELKRSLQERTDEARRANDERRKAEKDFQVRAVTPPPHTVSL